MTDAVLADRDDAGVLTLTFNRPDRHNGWSEELQLPYYALLESAAVDPDVRAVVVTGAGRSFCPGADMGRLTGLGEGGAGLPMQSPVPRRFPKPLIAAINGACAGVGLVQALWCHVRFAADTAKFTTAFARRGLIAEYGMGWMLPRLVGLENALDLLVSARTIDAAEAKQLGLVSRVVPRDEVLPAAQAYARDIAVHCSPQAMATITREVLDGLDLPFEEAYNRSHEDMNRFLGGPDLREGVASFLEKRPPRFPPLQEG
ncbi:enoyl-CoA hydratase-related protein [Pseudonocardia sp. TRM90224]|uniref:enoyl-CoA hydratase-related protein n=1 Tax=Pseudonocardia sp. TRM90224 TaxID=2812678 RepID=UPI001E3349DA|nr:enoyl-CoA hydratase-related protein [Pseudonocardia sp. TRM90224]